MTVVAGTRRADLVLPGWLPVAELLPALARHLGLLDDGTAHGGYRLVAPEGRELGGDTGLLRQGVGDGSLLALCAGVGVEPPRVYDDVVEAVADAVERELAPWDRATGRRTARAAAGLSAALGAAALLTQRGSVPAAVSATGLAVGLVGVGVAMSRVRHEPGPAVVAVWLATAYAAVAGLLLAGRAAPGVLLAAAGAGGLLTGLAGLVGLATVRAWLAPPMLAGTVLLAGGLVVRGTGFEPAAVLTTLLVLAVMTASVLPWLALDATRLRVPSLPSAGEAVAIDPAGIAADVRAAHELLVALSASVGLLLVLVGPFAVSLGLAGTLVAVLASLVTVLRTRQYRSGVEVLVGSTSGVAGLVAVAGAVLWLHPAWRPAGAAALTVSGGVLLAGTLLPATPSARRERLGDVAESVSLLLLPPLLVVAVGLLGAVRR